MTGQGLPQGAHRPQGRAQVCQAMGPVQMRPGPRRDPGNPRSEAQETSLWRPSPWVCLEAAPAGHQVGRHMALKGGGPSGAVHRAQRGWRLANQLSVGPAAGDTWGGLGVSVWASCPLHMDSARPVEGAQSCARDTSVDRVDGYDFAHDMLLFLVGCVLKLCTDTCRWLTVVVSGKSDCMLLFVSFLSHIYRK